LAHPEFSRSVFVNCPFDWDFEPVLKAMLFCLVRFGLRPRVATERNNAGETRIDKIAELIKESEYSIHDLSRCQAREAGEHYRMNMPFELGMDFACRRYGGEPYSQKKILVLEEQKYRYQAALSDLAGIDIVPHEGKYELAVKAVRDWLAPMPGFERIAERKVLSEYEDFQEWYAEKRRADGFVEDDLRNVPVPELLQAMLEWMAAGRPRL
jgi:hypothetical protein